MLPFYSIEVQKMKLIIDIPEEQFTTLNAKTQAEVKTVIDYALMAKAIKNGTPVSTEGDLISRGALKEATKSFVDCDGFNPIWQIIDNAPTVEPEKVYLAKISFDKEQLQEIVDKAKAEVLASVERDEIVIRTAFKNYARKVMYEKNVTNFSLLKVFDEIIDNAPMQKGGTE